MRADLLARGPLVKLLVSIINLLLLSVCTDRRVVQYHFGACSVDRQPLVI
ncbi:MAG: hypothetical protein ACJAYG_000857 [Oceanicoccus sp.]|jgi:hypothetical protein